MGDGVGHHALAPHRLKTVEGTGWLSALLAGADQCRLGDWLPFSQSLFAALLPRDVPFSQALLAGAVGSAVCGDVGCFGVW